MFELALAGAISFVAGIIVCGLSFEFDRRQTRRKKSESEARAELRSMKEITEGVASLLKLKDNHFGFLGTPRDKSLVIKQILDDISNLQYNARLLTDRFNHLSTKVVLKKGRKK